MGMGKRNLTTEEIKKISFYQTKKMGCTVWHEAPNEGRLEVLQKIWEWVK
jgi:hypothetical protein